LDTVIAETPASAQAGDPVAEAESAAETLKRTKLEIAKKIVGQDEVVDLTLARNTRYRFGPQQQPHTIHTRFNAC